MDIGYACETYSGRQHVQQMLQRQLEQVMGEVDPLVQKRVWLQTVFRLPHILSLEDGSITYRWTNDEARKLDKQLGEYIDAIYKKRLSRHPVDTSEAVTTGEVDNG